MKNISAINIEQQILGSILIDNESLDVIVQQIQPIHFFDNKNKLIYSTILKMYNAGLSIDSITLLDALKKDGKDQACGGVKYLSGLSIGVISAANVIYHCRIVFEKWMLRELYLLSKSIAEQIESGKDDPFEIQSLAIEKFESLLRNIDNFDNDTSLADELDNVIENIERRYSGKDDNALKSRTFPSFNKMTGGIRESDFVCILGDYKQGKTTFAEQLALDFALNDNIPVGFFSLEMDKESLYLKAFSLRTGIDYQKLRSPKENGLTAKEFQNFKEEAKKIFKNIRFYVCDKPLDKYQIKAKMKLWKRKFGIGCFVVDYISLIPVNERKERRDIEVSDLSRFFKLAAKELKTPILMLSQANNDGKTAESKGLSRDADFVISVKKPVECGIREIKLKGNKSFRPDENHFYITLDYSRHGRNKISFIAAFVNNKFVELDVRNGTNEPVEYQNYYEKERSHFKRC